MQSAEMSGAPRGHEEGPWHMHSSGPSSHRTPTNHRPALYRNQSGHLHLHCAIPSPPALSPDDSLSPTGLTFSPSLHAAFQGSPTTSCSPYLLPCSPHKTCKRRQVSGPAASSPNRPADTPTQSCRRLRRSGMGVRGKHLFLPLAAHPTSRQPPARSPHVRCNSPAPPCAGFGARGHGQRGVRARRGAGAVPRRD